MSAQRSKRTVFIALGGAVFLAFVAWFVGQGIRSPAQIAAETAAPDPSAITVPVEKRVLSSEVIVRGTVRYGSPQPVVLAASNVKAGSGTGSGSDIVTTRPRRGSKFSEGSTVMSVSGRPVFVLRGAMASHRDMGPGSRGPDVRQLERSLVRQGFSPGQVDGRYDGATANAVATWYEKGGWEPFGATDVQLDQLRAAKATASAARDSYLRSLVDIKTARQNATPTEIEQARIELETARDSLDTAVRERASQRGAASLARANAARDNALAAADVATKRAALNRARDALTEAQRSLAEAPAGDEPLGASGTRACHPAGKRRRRCGAGRPHCFDRVREGDPSGGARRCHEGPGGQFEGTQGSYPGPPASDARRTPPADPDHAQRHTPAAARQRGSRPGKRARPRPTPRGWPARSASTFRLTRFFSSRHCPCASTRFAFAAVTRSAAE